MKGILASALALSLVACGDEGNGSANPTPTATPNPSPTADPAAGGVCEYLEQVVVTAIANAESRGLDASDVAAALGEAQFRLQELGVDFVARKRTEPFGRAILEVAATLAKIRFGVAAGDSEQIQAFADQARGHLELEPIVERCGEIGTGAA